MNHRRQVTERLIRVSDGAWTAKDVGYYREDLYTKEKIFNIRMPISGLETELRIDLRAYHGLARYSTITGEISKLVDYVTKTQYMLKIARDIQPYNRDISPLSIEEYNVFGVVQNQPNTCMPFNYRKYL